MIGVKWCSRILSLHRERRRAKFESGLLFSLTFDMSPLREIMDVASKMLVPLGMINSLEFCQPHSQIRLEDGNVTVSAYQDLWC